MRGAVPVLPDLRRDALRFARRRSFHAVPPRLAALAPGLGVVEAVVEDLARTESRIAVLSEVAGQTHEVGVRRAEPGAVPDDARRRRLPSCQHRRS